MIETPVYIGLIDRMTVTKLKEFLKRVESRRDELKDLLKYGKKKLKKYKYSGLTN